MYLRGFWILIFISVLGGIHGMSARAGKDYYCKDPDTGKLHPVNTTWASSAFCGNYTCKIKKKNGNSNKLLELLTNKSNKERTQVIENKNKDNKIVFSTITKVDTETVMKQSVFHKVQNKSHDPGHEVVNLTENDTFQKKKLQTDLNSDADRLLSNNEIKTLTKLLKSMKVSELDAVLQVFNLAHDIYSEVDKMVIDEESNEITSASPQTTINKEAFKDKDNASYWYEPLTITNNGAAKYDDIFFFRNLNDKKITPKTTKAPLEDPLYVDNTSLKLKTKPHKQQNTDLFTKMLTKDESGNVETYRSITAFQKQASYTHNPIESYPHQNSGKIISQVHNLFESPMLPAPNVMYQGESNPITTLPIKEYNNKKKCCQNKKLNAMPWIDDKENLLFHVEPKKYLSLPRAIGSGNTMLFPLKITDNNEKTQPSSFLTITNSKKLHKAPLSSPYKSQGSDRIFRDQVINQLTRLRDSPSILTPLENSVEDLLSSSWSSASAGVPVFNDVKSPEEAIASGNLLPFPFKKNSKAKAHYSTKQTRKKRDDKQSNLNPEFETYLEKLTCKTDNEPGFFRMGDPSKPYPACCPQRIEKNTQRLS